MRSLLASFECTHVPRPWRALRLALRPQQVKYDHSWWTNLFGGTSAPHPGPAAKPEGERSADDSDR